jgi:hypothetical protein
VTYPTPRIDRHEPFNALIVLIALIAAAAVVALMR